LLAVVSTLWVSIDCDIVTAKEVHGGLPGACQLACPKHSTNPLSCKEYLGIRGSQLE
jgi:hypothetical protein